MNILYKYILPFIIFVIFFTIAKVGMREFFSHNSSNTYESNVISLDVCKDISSEVNRAMPTRVDEVTTTTTTMCIPEYKNKSASLMYMRTIDTNSPLWTEYTNNDSEIIKSIMKNNEDELLNGFCTNPDMRMLLDGLVSIIYNYSSIDGTHITKFSINKNDCKIR